MTHPSIHNAKIHTAESQAENSWISLILNYLRSRALPEERSEVVKVKARAAKYALINDILYKRSFFGPYQRCVPPEKVKRIIEQIHGGICGTHISDRSLCHKIMTYGFYWPTMKQESELFVRNYNVCQNFGNIIHVPATTLHSVSSPWPFYK